MSRGSVFVLSNRQQKKLQEIIDCFYNTAVNRNVLPPGMLLLTGGVRRAIIDGDTLEQYHLDYILWLLDLFFAQMEGDDCDPLAEQAYQKIAGWWPVEPPWYEKV